MEKTLGLLVGIYESKEIGNCSNGGISSRCKSAILVGEGIAKVFGPSPECPAVKLVHRTICGKPYVHAEPVESKNGNNVGYMAGGTFIYTCDSRFPSSYPIPLHDRQETPEQYERLST